MSSDRVVASKGSASHSFVFSFQLGRLLAGAQLEASVVVTSIGKVKDSATSLTDWRYDVEKALIR